MTSPPRIFPAAVVPFEVPESMRAFAEKGVSQARENYAKLKHAAETGNGTIEAVYSSATKGASEYSAKVMDLTKTNTDAALDFAQGLLAAKSLPKAFELWSNHARKQLEVLTAQAQDLAAFSQKIATETVEPIKAGASKAFKPLA